MSNKPHSRTRAREDGSADSAASPPDRNEGQQLLRQAAERLADVAAELHVGISTVSDWRRGAKVPGGKARARLFEAYGIPVDAWDRLPVDEAVDDLAADMLSAPEGGLPDPLGVVEEQLAHALARQRLRGDVMSDIDASRLSMDIHRHNAQRAALLDARATAEDRLVESELWASIKGLLRRVLARHPDALEDLDEGLRVLGVGE
jgi:transcriptional regulator with XRE-family HTH domain